MRQIIFFKTNIFLLFGLFLLFSCKKDDASTEIPIVPNQNFNPNLSYGTMSDIDGNTYKTIKIGGQTWMAENLKVSRYRDGSPISTNLNDVKWQNTSNGAYSIYKNDTANNSTYGKLYNWYAVTDVKNLCPEGWHIPSYAEWTTLENALGGTEVAGGKLKSTSYLWSISNPFATNESGFSAMPGGCRYGFGAYYYVGEYGYWWSKAEGTNTVSWVRSLSHYGGNLNRGLNYKQDGLSVRCLKD